MKYFVSAVAAGLLLSQSVSAQTVECAPSQTAKAEVEQTIRDFFDALRGEGVQKDIGKSLDWLARAAQAGHGEANRFLQQIQKQQADQENNE